LNKRHFLSKIVVEDRYRKITATNLRLSTYCRRIKWRYFKNKRRRR